MLYLIMTQAIGKMLDIDWLSLVGRDRLPYSGAKTARGRWTSRFIRLASSRSVRSINTTYDTFLGFIRQYSITFRYGYMNAQYISPLGVTWQRPARNHFKTRTFSVTWLALVILLHSTWLTSVRMKTMNNRIDVENSHHVGNTHHSVM
jgi:hypothetical protein